MRCMTSFNDGWVFDDGDVVRLPHTAVELPYNYFDETSYQRTFTYEKRFLASSDWDGQEVSLHFEGAMANARVSLNGKELLNHPDGYTPFEVRLQELLTQGENVLSVEIDGSENPNIPPFGGQIDYLTYAGIYRDVWLNCVAPINIGSHKIETPDSLDTEKTVFIVISLNNPQSLPVSGTLVATILDATGAEIAVMTQEVFSDSVEFRFTSLYGIELWDIDNPNLYTLHLRLETPLGNDSTETRFGFRDARFTNEGFILNGRHLKIRGLNRHQSFPYVGYALGQAAQARDADILKNELHLNLVRTSHYPQSRWFLDRCDEIGLLVFEEIPGWQHIGDDKWKSESIQNVRRMIERDWNHPSIILWGVRVNESSDDHDFYTETNRIAHDLDPTRQTGGVRCITDSELLEDVYTMNDFILGECDNPLGTNRPRTPLRPQKEVTGLDHPVPYMITEYNGHMHPTKSFDQEQRQAEHVIRHLEVLDAAYGAEGTAGAIGWCAFDYNTHKDFGSGDRICYHGVMDMFREPKFAAYAYSSQCDPDVAVVLEPVTFWARGERNIHGVLPLLVLTNCDEVEFIHGDHEPIRIGPDRTRFPHLPYAPIIAKPTDFSKDGLGGWGMTWEHGQIIGYRDGQMVADRSFVSDPLPTKLAVVPDQVRIAPFDTVRVMIRALDQAGNKLPFLNEPATIIVTGAGLRIGPEMVPLIAGSTGFWIRSIGAGPISIEVNHARFAQVVCEIVAERE